MGTKTKSDTITASDMVTKDVDSLFSTLDLPALHTVADFYGVDQEDTIQEQVIALTAGGVSYALYAKDFQVPLPADYQDELDSELELEDEPLTTQLSGPVTADRSPALAPQNEYLIRMTRENPYFEVASVSEPRKVFKFTQDHPYAIMDARTAQFVLEHEFGFRQAFPDELREFYED